MSHVSCSTKKVIGVVAKSRKEHWIAQTRELACTKEFLTQVIASGMSSMKICARVCISVCEIIR